MNDIEELFANNRQWAADMEAQRPGFFSQLSRQQAPRYLWIGCSDSRVPANEIVGLLPGELFVHRNVANLVVHTDLNCLSVLQFAVDVLGVRHIMVTGHYGCGGVRAALGEESLGLIDNWLLHLKDIRLKYQQELDGIADEHARVDRLCEINVIEQVQNVSRTTVIQQAWAAGKPVTIHGWIYGLQDGLLKDLNVAISGP